MRVGMFTDSYFPQISGVATSIKVLKEELEAQGHDVIIFTTTDPNAKEDEENVVRLKSIPFFSFKDRRIAIKGFANALKEAKKYHVDIIHTHTEFSLGLTGRFIGYKLDIPTIHTYHTMYEKYLHYIAKGKVLRPRNVATVSRVFCNRMSGIVVPSQLMKEMLASYQVYKEIRVIPTGVPIPEPVEGIREKIRSEIGLDDEDQVLLSLSRLAFEKNLHKIIEAFPTVLAKHPRAKLVFVGDGPARSFLEEMVEDLKVSHAVSFVGEVDHQDVHHYYQMADVYVNASESETQGLTYLESVANGCPVVAKRNDYLEEIIKNPMLGLLFQDDASMGEAIVHMLEHLNAPPQEKWLEEKETLLKEISAKQFGQKMIRYYKSVIENYYLENKLENIRPFRNVIKIKMKSNR